MVSTGKTGEIEETKAGRYGCPVLIDEKKRRINAYIFIFSIEQTGSGTGKVSPAAGGRDWPRCSESTHDGLELCGV
jgi:hypothetical protein